MGIHFLLNHGFLNLDRSLPLRAATYSNSDSHRAQRRATCNKLE